MDAAFHGADGKPGLSFDNREWPHGWTGSANPHGVECGSKLTALPQQPRKLVVCGA